MNNKETPIDIFLAWVDGDDPEWAKEKEYYAKELKGEQVSASSKARFESWDNLHYLFRGIEECMPWVNKVYFVTWGHIPAFLNVNHPKLVIVKHEDFIPKEYLPTFNASTIEMNLHRIKDLSENVILLNDDMFPLKPIEKSYYFKNDKVCDEAIERTFNPRPCKGGSKMVFHYLLNDVAIINKHFKKREVQKKYFWKWFHPCYGKKMLRNIALHYFYDFDYFTNPHEAQALKKSTLIKIWEKEPELLDAASRNKFRFYNDVNQYLIRFWELCEGNFCPSARKGKCYSINDKNYKSIAEDIRKKRYLMVSVNEGDNQDEWLVPWGTIKNEINGALESVFPNKSTFEL